MIRRATERLVVASGATVAGALIAVLAGMPEAAVLATPWALLLVLGIARSRREEPTTAVEVDVERVVVGDEIEVTTRVADASGYVKVQCDPSPGFWRPGDDKSSRLASLHDVIASGADSVTCSLPATQWGTHDVGRVVIEVTEPHALFRWSGAAERPAPVRVHPTSSQLRQLIAPRFVRQVTGTHESKAVGRGVEYADIRPYSQGDSLRQINWRVTARTGELWVSERHPDRATEVILLVDSFVESGHDVRAVVGMAIEAAVSLAQSHLSSADRVGLLEIGGTVRWISPGTSHIQLQRLTDALLATGLYAHVADRQLDLVLARVLPPRSLVVALTPLLDHRFIDVLFVVAGHGHDVAVIEAIAPRKVADSTTGDVGRVANRLWDAERQVVRDSLADHGVAVAPWVSGEHLDVTLRELARRRQRTMRAVIR